MDLPLSFGAVADFQILFETMPEACIVFTPNLTIAAANNAYLKITMTVREEIIGRHLFDVFPDNPHDHEATGQNDVRSSLERVLQNRAADQIEVKYDIRNSADGEDKFEERFWNLYSLPILDEQQKVRFIIHRVWDITETIRARRRTEINSLEKQKLELHTQIAETARQEAEAALQDAQLRLEVALEAGEIGTWSWNIIEDKVVADKNLAHFFSVSKADAAGGKIKNYVSAIHPDDRERITAVINKVIENGGTYEADYRLLNFDGEIRWVVARGEAVADETGKVISLPGVVIDISARKKSEEDLRESQIRLALALQAGRAGTFVWNIAADVNVWSPEIEALYGVSPGTFEGNYQAWSQRVIPEDAKIVENGIKQALENNLTDYEYEFRAVLPDQSQRWLAARARFEYDANQKPLRMLGINFDITERKQAEEERERLLQNEQTARFQAENANRLKDEFLATVSHELRTPLNAIMGWAHILQTTEIDEAMRRKALTIIERNARAQNQLIDDLLDVSRIITGKLRLDVRAVDLANVVTAAVDSVRPAAEAKDIRLQILLDPAAGLVSGDPDRLQQVIWNLLSNAVKFTPKNGRVQLRLERVNSHIEIVVSDTGKGIGAEFLPHVFDRFRQADQTSTRNHGGLGLGLAIVRQLVELHGGEVAAVSKGENQGTTFTVSLPLLPLRSEISDNADKVHPTAAQFSTALEFPPELDGLRILIVDDEADARELLTAALTLSGGSVASAGSAAEALEQLAAAPFDVIVTDIGMPEEDGYSLIQKVRTLAPERGGSIPAVALTAYARAEDRVRALRAGFQMHVPKPVEPVELIAVVATLGGLKKGNLNLQN